MNTVAACITAVRRGMQDQAGVALGQASLTVTEQATMLATIDDNGVYHDAHVITSITRTRPPTPIKITSHPVFSSDPTLNAEEATAGPVRDVRGHRPLRHRAERRDEQRPGDHRQDRHHEHRAVGVLHRRHPEPGPGRRDLHQRTGQGHRDARQPRRHLPGRRTAAPGRPRSGTPTPRTSSSRWESSSSPRRSSPAATWNQVPPGLRKVAKKHKKTEPRPTAPARPPSRASRGTPTRTPPTAVTRRW